MILTATKASSEIYAKVATITMLLEGTGEPGLMPILNRVLRWLVCEWSRGEDRGNAACRRRLSPARYATYLWRRRLGFFR